MLEKNIVMGNESISKMEESIKALKQESDWDIDIQMKPFTILEQQYIYIYRYSSRYRLLDTVAEMNAASDTLYYISQGFGRPGSASADVFIKVILRLDLLIFVM